MTKKIIKLILLKLIEIPLIVFGPYYTMLYCNDGIIYNNNLITHWLMGVFALLFCASVLFLITIVIYSFIYLNLRLAGFIK